MRYVNIHFSIQNPKGSIKGLWKVTADESYHPLHKEGFPHYCLFLTYRGSGDIYLKNSTAPVHMPENSSFILTPGTECHYHRHLYSKEWNFYFLEFNMPPVLKDEPLPFLKPLPPIERGRLICEEFTDEIAWNRPGRDAVLEKGLLDILNPFVRVPSQKTDGIEGVLKWMHDHPDLDCRLNDLLKMSGCTRTSFFTRFRDKTGETPQVYFRNLKIKAARSLLETTNLKISDIAERLNYCDEYYFSRQFKQVTGKSPLNWKKSRL
jgi:AraC-like DNA-binding protein